MADAVQALGLVADDDSKTDRGPNYCHVDGCRDKKKKTAGNSKCADCNRTIHHYCSFQFHGYSIDEGAVIRCSYCHKMAVTVPAPVATQDEIDKKAAEAAESVKAAGDGAAALAAQRSYDPTFGVNVRPKAAKASQSPRKNDFVTKVISQETTPKTKEPPQSEIAPQKQSKKAPPPQATTPKPPPLKTNKSPPKFTFSAPRKLTDVLAELRQGREKPSEILPKTQKPTSEILPTWTTAEYAALEKRQMEQRKKAELEKEAKEKEKWLANFYGDGTKAYERLMKENKKWQDDLAKLRIKTRREDEDIRPEAPDLNEMVTEYEMLPVVRNPLIRNRGVLVTVKPKGKNSFMAWVFGLHRHVSSVRRGTADGTVEYTLDGLPHNIREPAGDVLYTPKLDLMEDAIFRGKEHREFCYRAGCAQYRPYGDRTTPILDGKFEHDQNDELIHEEYESSRMKTVEQLAAGGRDGAGLNLNYMRTTHRWDVHPIAKMSTIEYGFLSQHRVNRNRPDIVRWRKLYETESRAYVEQQWRRFGHRGDLYPIPNENSCDRSYARSQFGAYYVDWMHAFLAAPPVEDDLAWTDLPLYNTLTPSRGYWWQHTRAQRALIYENQMQHLTGLYLPFDGFECERWTWHELRTQFARVSPRRRLFAKPVMMPQLMPPVAYYYGVQLSDKLGLPEGDLRRKWLERIEYKELVLMKLITWYNHYVYGNKVIVLPPDVLEELRNSGIAEADLDLGLGMSPADIIERMERGRSASFALGAQPARNQQPNFATIQSQVFGVDSLQFHWIDTQPEFFGCPHRTADARKRLFFDSRTRVPLPFIQSAVKSSLEIPYQRFQPWNPDPDNQTTTKTAVYVPWKSPADYKPPTSLGYTGDTNTLKRPRDPIPIGQLRKEKAYGYAADKEYERIKRVKLNDEALEKAAGELALTRFQTLALTNHVQNLNRRVLDLPGELSMELTATLTAVVSSMLDGFKSDCEAKATGGKKKSGESAKGEGSPGTQAG